MSMSSLLLSFLPFLLVYWMILTNLELKAGESLFSKRKK